VQALLSNLEEEKQTDDKLTGLAKRMVNPDDAT
jgi:ferritin-like metal-binding protein YciE